jgi:predicted PurR-regulated permease PerM
MRGSLLNRKKTTDDLNENVPYTREHLSLIALLILAAVGIGLSVLVARPFIPGLSWALAFAVVATPIHEWIRSRMDRDGLSAALAVSIVVLMLVVPITFVGWQIGKQATEAARSFDGYLQSGEWQEKLKKSPRMASVWGTIEETIDVKEEAKNIAAGIRQRATGWISTAVGGVIQLLIAFFALFYFFRDRASVLMFVRSMMPMSEKETNLLFKQVTEMTQATIFGTVVVALVQGALGGLMFWILQVPGALLWGFCMGVLSIIPVLGAFVIWMPAAVYLVMEGAIVKALILAAWGIFAVGLIDNFLYPVLVGNKMRLHTLPVFISIAGGLFLFGAAGVVIGPVILSATIALLDILRRRTAHGRSAEQQT